MVVLPGGCVELELLGDVVVLVVVPGLAVVVVAPGRVVVVGCRHRGDGESDGGGVTVKVTVAVLDRHGPVPVGPAARQ